MPTAFLGLGSNLGDRRANLRSAVQAMGRKVGAEWGSQLTVASLYETSPVDVTQPQPPFYNSVLRIHAEMTPRELWASMLEIESTLGRSIPRNSARPIDLDLLLFGDQIIEETDLTVPHPRMHVRRFVMEPLAEVAPRVVHPRLNIEMHSLAERLRAEWPQQVVTYIESSDWVGRTVDKQDPSIGVGAARGTDKLCP